MAGKNKVEMLDGNMLDKYKGVFPITVRINDKDLTIRLSSSWRHGSEELENIQWRKLVFDEFKGYDSINMMLFKVESIPEIIREEDVTKDPNAHIDAKTGNIHPGKEYVKEHSRNYDKVRQLVLCAAGGNDLGPKLPAKLEDDPKEDVYYIYSTVHKSCFYPRIDNIELEDGEDWRHDLLKQVWNELEKAGLTERD